MTALFDENNNIVSGTLNIGSGTVYDIVLSDTAGNATLLNQNNLNIDFAVSGTGNGDVLFYDASTSRLGINSRAPDAALHVVTDCTLDGIKVESVTNCATGVKLLLVHNTQTAPETGSFPATIDLAGRDNNFNTINYGQVKSKILNPATNSTSGEIIFTVDHTGVNKEVFRSSLLNTVLGGLNSPSGQSYNVIGYNNTASGLSYIVLGNMNDTIHDDGIIVGNDLKASGNKVVILGNNSSASGDFNIGVLVDSTVSGVSNLALGASVQASGSHNTLIGNTNIASGNKNIGLLSNANVIGHSGIGFGNTVNARGNFNVYVGNDLTVSGSNDVVVGSNINATGNKNIVYGNNSNVSGNSVISIGVNNDPQSITSGVYIGNDISLSHSTKSVIIGLGVTTTSGLDDSILLGLDNSTTDSSPTGLVIIGQSNTVSDIKDSLIIGNNNNLTGTVSNNIVIGPRNNVPVTSNNNLVVGVLNNTTGIVINTDGTFTGSGVKAAGDSMSNTTVFGINNWVSAASGSTIVGNKTRVSGLNINNIGSYVNLNGTDVQNIGNSNFVVGKNNTTLGSKNDIIGSGSISINTADDRNQVFGNSSIVLGHNEVIVSGISVGYDNEVYSADNLVYGRNNTIGYARYPCRVSGTNVVIIGNVSDFNGGDRILVGLYSPASQDNAVFVRNILDGTDSGGASLGVVKENLGNNYTTTLVTNTVIDSDNTIEYYVKESFDEVVQGLDPCSECFADRFAGYSSGYVMAYQDGNNDATPATSPQYGRYSIVLGSSNTARHMSGLILGNHNHISGISNVVIGHGLSGTYNETLQIGTNNTNKMYLDDYSIVFNTGLSQHSIIFKSSNAGGDNSPYTMYTNLLTNRVGVNTNDARSTLDVSGTLTTDQLRIGLSSISGYSLHTDVSGFSSWKKPVTLIGQNSGLVFKTSDTVGSGMKEIFFNTASGVKTLEYTRANKILSPSASFDYISGDETEDRVVIINQTGLFLNNAGNDYGYNFVIKGSGVQNAVAGDNSIYLFKTHIEDNAVRVHNITGVSGQFGSMNIGGTTILPLNLTGTVLGINGTNGTLESKTFGKFDVLFAHKDYSTSGSNSLRYYPDDSALTIGLTGTPPETSHNSLVQGASNSFNHIILSSAAGNNTVFNNAGLGNQFIISESGQGGTKLGFHYYTASGALGLGVSDTNLWNVTPANQNRPWWEAGKLVVDGKIRASALQLTADGRAGGSTANRYLKVVDTAGNIGLDTLDLSYQFSGIHPVGVATDTGDQIVTMRLATTDENNIALGTSANGTAIVWNGAKWAHARGFNFPQPENGSTNTDVTPGIELGNDLSLNSCRNNHVEGAGSFARGTSSFDGSSQNSRFFLRGRTGGQVQYELTSDWHKNANTTPIATNTISLQYLDSFDDTNPVDHKRTMVWNYTVNYSAAFSDDAGTPAFGAAGGKVEGTIMSYIASDGTRTTTKLGGETITKRSTGADYSATDVVPIIVKPIDDGANLNVQRLGVIASGVAGWNGMWHAVVDINQVHMPSGIVFGNSAIV
jgi:hypothetical protein